MDKEILTIDEAAELLRCGDWKLREMCKAGGFPYFKIGNEYRFKYSSIMEWIEKQEKMNRYK